MNIPLLYALIMAIGQIALTLVSFFLGYQTEQINQGTWFGFIPLIYGIAVYWFSLKSVREENAGQYLTYGQGVGAGILVALYSGLLGSLYTYIHFTWVNPNFTDYLIEASRVKWAAANLSEAQMEGAEKGVRMFTRPALQAGFGFVATLVIGLIIALILAAFLKRNPPEES
ncbi:MAG: DUF4199 domain-containing protein [Opitutaceae bacterium]|nr:DUF4199 domain-containing protein [Opitutaceae bacterium]